MSGILINTLTRDMQIDTFLIGIYKNVYSILQVHEDFKSFISECYDSYAESIEDKEPFGKYLDEPNNTA